MSERMEQLTAGPIWEHLGLKLINAKDGDSEVHLIAKKEFTQLHGTVHGGILSTLIDASMAAAMNSLLQQHELTVTTEMKVNFLSPVNHGLLIAKGHVIKRGKTLCLVESYLTDENERLICHGTATFFVFEK